MHDVGLTRIPRNTAASRWRAARSRAGSSSAGASRRRTRTSVASAILLHMQPSVTLEDGVEAVLLDRATGLDVRGAGFDSSMRSDPPS